MSNKENAKRRTVTRNYRKSDRGHLTAVAGQQQCRKADLFRVCSVFCTFGTLLI